MYIEAGLAVLLGFVTMVGTLRCLGYTISRQSTSTKPTPDDLKLVKKFIKCHDSGSCDPTALTDADYANILQTLRKVEKSVGSCCTDNIKRIRTTVHTHHNMGKCCRQALSSLLSTKCIREQFGENVPVVTVNDFLTLHLKGECVEAPTDMRVDDLLLERLGPKTAESLKLMIRDHHGTKGCEYHNQYAAFSEIVLDDVDNECRTDQPPYDCPSSSAAAHTYLASMPTIDDDSDMDPVSIQNRFNDYTGAMVHTESKPRNKTESANGGNTI